MWRTTVRPELNVAYDDVWRSELKFVRLLDETGWPPVGYGGQIDLVADLRSKSRAVDIKTGSLRTAHKMQAVAYQRAFPELEGAALVHVSPTGKWHVDWSEDWPTESLWQQFRAEVVMAVEEDEFDVAAVAESDVSGDVEGVVFAELAAGGFRFVQVEGRFAGVQAGYFEILERVGERVRWIAETVDSEYVAQQNATLKWV